MRATCRSCYARPGETAAARLVNRHRFRRPSPWERFCRHVERETRHYPDGWAWLMAHLPRIDMDLLP